MATLIERINTLRASSLPFAAPKRVSQTTEASLVRDVLQLLQGYPTANLPWDDVGQRFCVRNGVHCVHLSQSSLFNILQGFIRAATSLRRVEFFIRRVMKGTTASWLKSIAQAHPTLEAFVNVVYMRLELLRRVALEKELEAVAGDAGTSVTLLSLFGDLSRVIAGAEFLEHIVNVTVPEHEKFFKNKVNAAELATHILSSLYEELDSFCLLQDGEEEAYQTLLLLFVGCLKPMIASLDSWLQEGILNDPAGELFFFEDKTVPIEDSAFWENGYHLYSMDTQSGQDSRFHLVYKSPKSSRDSSSTTQMIKKNSRFRRLSTDSNSSLKGECLRGLICPSFLQPLAKSILSAGKSLRLLQHVRRKHVEGDEGSSQVVHPSSKTPSPFLPLGLTFSIQGHGKKGLSELEAIASSDFGTSELNQESEKGQISLYGQFCASLCTLVGVSPVQTSSKENSSGLPEVNSGYFAACSKRGVPGKEELLDVLYSKGRLDLGKSVVYRKNEIKQNQGNQGTAEDMSCKRTTAGCTNIKKVIKLSDTGTVSEVMGNELSDGNERNHVEPYETDFNVNFESHVTHQRKWRDCLNLAQYCQLPGLGDEHLRRAIFDPSNEDENHIGKEDAGMFLHNLADEDICHKETERQSRLNLRAMGSKNPFCKVTDFKYGQGCGKLLFLHDICTLTSVESLLPYPTLLPSYQERCNISVQLPSQRHSTPSMLEWIQRTNLKATPAFIVVQECLTSSIQKQVDHVGQQLLSKLMGEWCLMEEFALLRAIYLVGSGDLLQQFASVLFNKLDRGEPWDDFYELNTMLQESVRSSSHGMVLPALDSLVVTVLPRPAGKFERGNHATASPPQIAGRAPLFGIDALDSLFFTYKVAWPLELIVGSSAIKKYNQVMLFLLKVKRAKHALDKACRWTWKNGVGDAAVHKQRVLLQQKLMHFVNTLHQYVMDRVLYSAWVELSENVSSAGSLDEVIACHDAYLVSIQRQCIVAPDKLWTLIASRVKTILGLALTYYSIQRVLCDGVGASAISARCQLEIERVEQQFDECMVFLMRVLSFKLNVGHFPHLADLVTRINYNFYYMTEDGELSTPLPETLGQVTKRLSRRI